ncbi:hypothetical protein U9S01_09905, partial [Peribacillus frigoritolerans]|nr:hypothetical protein [Peribacillus frigoritolerans]
SFTIRLAFKRNLTAFPQLNIEKRPQLKKYSFFIVYLTGLCAKCLFYIGYAKVESLNLKVLGLLVYNT